MGISKYPELCSPIVKTSENEQENTPEEITNLFGITTAEQIEIPMENEKPNSSFDQKTGKKKKLPLDSSLKPEKRMERAYQELNNKLADDLLERIMGKDPWFFEQLVIKLLLSMGYGDPDSKDWVITPKAGDGGIDGIIKQDKLGFDRIYIQAKQWKPETSVSRPEIQKFSGALNGVNANRGLFITTAKFSQGAIDYAEQQRIVLVDGKRLTKLMIEYNVGVSTVAKYEIKAIDSDFFNNEKS